MHLALALTACTTTWRPPDDPGILSILAERGASRADLAAMRDVTADPAALVDGWHPLNQYPWSHETSGRYQIRFERDRVCVRYDGGDPQCAERTRPTPSATDR